MKTRSWLLMPHMILVCIAMILLCLAVKEGEETQRKILKEIQTLVEGIEKRLIVLEQKAGERENEGVEHQESVGEFDSPGI